MIPAVRVSAIMTCWCNDSIYKVYMLTPWQGRDLGLPELSPGHREWGGNVSGKDVIWCMCMMRKSCGNDNTLEVKSERLNLNH